MSEQSIAAGDVCDFLDEIGEMDAFAARIGETEVEIRGEDGQPKKISVRPVPSGVHSIVLGAIPSPKVPTKKDDKNREVPDFDDAGYLMRKSLRASAVGAATAAVAIGLALEDGRTYHQPGPGERNRGRAQYLRDAAKLMLSSYSTEEIQRILAANDEASNPDELLTKAGKDSAPTGKTSKKRLPSGAKQDHGTSATSSPTSAPSD